MQAPARHLRGLLILGQDGLEAVGLPTRPIHPLDGIALRLTDAPGRLATSFGDFPVDLLLGLIDRPFSDPDATR